MSNYKPWQFDIALGKFLETQDASGLPLIERVEKVQERAAFAEPKAFEKEPRIFETKEEDMLEGEYEGEPVYAAYMTNGYYPYALASAILCQTKKILDEKNHVEKPERPPQQTDARVKKVLQEWKDKHQEDDAYFKEIVRLKAPTTYYRGKAGDAMRQYAELDKLSKDDLASIIGAATGIVDGAKANVKDNGQESWFSTARVHTPKGDKEYEDLKNETLHNFGFRDDNEYKQKKQWIEEFSFEEGWQYKDKESDIEVVSLDSLSKRANDCIVMFNYGFIINAVNKDQLYLEEKE